MQPNGDFQPQTSSRKPTHGGTRPATKLPHASSSVKTRVMRQQQRHTTDPFYNTLIAATNTVYALNNTPNTSPPSTQLPNYRLRWRFKSLALGTQCTVRMPLQSGRPTCNNTSRTLNQSPLSSSLLTLRTRLPPLTHAHLPQTETRNTGQMRTHRQHSPAEVNHRPQ